MARRGARALHGDEPGTAAAAWREAVARDRGGDRWQPEERWVRTDDEAGAQPEGRPAARRVGEDRQRYDGPAAGPGGGAGTRQPRHTVPKPVVEELASEAGAQRGAKLAARLADATHAYEHDRFQEARRILRPLAEQVPDSAAVLELYGLTLYRLGQWSAAARYLELYRARTASFDQHPVLADCYRALHRYARVDELWQELRESSPSAELVAEGRIVAAGTLADQGRLEHAIATLERAGRRVNNPREHHLRQWYALADLYERAGDLPRARDLFSRVAAAAPDAFDVRVRLRALR